MLRRPTRRRAGTSLVEVLVGFGILGIGVTSVITLFPFSALTFGQALRDDRTTTCAVIADGELRPVHQQVVESVQNSPGHTTSEPYFNALDNPAGAGGGPNSPKLPALSPTDSAPSYPVYIDPMGWYATTRRDVGDSGQTGIPRVSLQCVTSSDVALRFCSLMDSLTYDDDGRVPPSEPGMRELRYNFAWVVQRPTNRDRFTLRMQVVVYNKRAHLYAPPGSEVVFPNVTFTPGETAIVVPVAADVRKGSWVMDAGNLQPAQNQPMFRHAEFYRVLSVTDIGGGSLALELHKPVSRPDGSTTPYPANLVVLPGVADVYERPNLVAGKQ
jgi:hypothetical protein